ncbi:MAG: hypothetical protein ACI8ZM_003607 [Crocinitomix sp.]|jgi:hypothetical protein
MKKLLLFIVLFYFNLFAFTQSTYVPDDSFEQALIDLGLDTEPLDDFVPTAAIDTVTVLNLINLEIADLTGVSDFANLRVLICLDNDLETLDISSNLLLESLNFSYNNISILDISMNVNLVEIMASLNNLETLDLAANLLLETIEIDRNNFENLDVTNNTQLKRLRCGGNILEELNVTENLELELLDFKWNLLTEIDVTANESLTSLYMSGNPISVLDLTGNPNLNFLSCQENNLTNLDLSENGLLEYISCKENMISALNVFNNPYLRTIECAKNPIAVLDLTNNDSLRIISYFETNVTIMDFSHIPYLEEVLAADMPNLSELNVANGNNSEIALFAAYNCPNLTCITLDEDYISTAEELTGFWTKDASTVYSVDCASLSIEESVKEITFYPSLFVNFIAINSPISTGFSVFNLAGKTVCEGNVHNGENRVDLSPLESGIYLLHFNGERETQTYKIVKK